MIRINILTNRLQSINKVGKDEIETQLETRIEQLEKDAKKSEPEWMKE